MQRTLLPRLGAELIGTAWLVFGGCGAAVLAAAFPQMGIGFVGVALAFGAALLSMAYAFAAISGAHFNPSVTIGLTVARRFPTRELVPYIVAQVVGAVIGAAVLYFIANGQPGFDASSSGFAANGYGVHSPGLYGLGACLLAEVVLTFGFVMVVLGATSASTAAGFAPLAIGVALTLVHLVGIPVTNTSVNPARSTGVAFFQGSWALQQLWLFWLAPVVGGLLAGLVHSLLERPAERPTLESGRRPPLITTTGEEVR